MKEVHCKLETLYDTIPCQPVLQPVESWRQLPAVPNNTLHFRAAKPLIGKGSAGRILDKVPEAAQLDQGMPDAIPSASKGNAGLAAGAEQVPAVTVAVGFAGIPSGLCVCIAVADFCGTESAELCLRTLIEPVWPDAADAKVWQQTVVPLSGSKSDGVGVAPVTGRAHEPPSSSRDCSSLMLRRIKLAGHHGCDIPPPAMPFREFLGHYR